MRTVRDKQRKRPTFALKYCNGKSKYIRGANKHQRKPKWQEWTGKPETLGTKHTDEDKKTKNKQKTTTATQKTKTMSNTNPTKFLKWGQVSRNDRVVGMQQTEKQIKLISLVSKHTFVGYNLVLYCTFSASMLKFQLLLSYMYSSWTQVKT